MELKIISLDKTEVGKLKLPRQFEEPIRGDLIKRAFESLMSHKRQPYGADPRAGKKHSVKLSRRRRDYKGSYGIGISRVPRKVLSRSGTRFNWVGAYAPGTVGGRRAFPPRARKVWWQKINDKERKKAIRSALSAVMNRDLILQRGHKLPEGYPFIISDDFEKIEKTKKIVEALKKIGIKEELERASIKKVRAGKGKSRGRKYKKKKGLLLVTGDKCSLMKSAKNIAGIDIHEIKNISIEALAPGGVPGRLAVFTQSAINKLAKEGLFN